MGEAVGFAMFVLLRPADGVQVYVMPVTGGDPILTVAPPQIKLSRPASATGAARSLIVVNTVSRQPYPGKGTISRAIMVPIGGGGVKVRVG